MWSKVTYAHTHNMTIQNYSLFMHTLTAVTTFSEKWIILYLRNFFKCLATKLGMLNFPIYMFIQFMPSPNPPTRLHSIQIVLLVRVHFCVNFVRLAPSCTVQARGINPVLNAVCIANRGIKEAFYICVPCVVASCGNRKSSCQSLLPNSNVVSLRAELMLVSNPGPPPKG